MCNLCVTVECKHLFRLLQKHSRSQRQGWGHDFCVKLLLFFMQHAMICIICSTLLGLHTVCAWDAAPDSSVSFCKPLRRVVTIVFTRELLGISMSHRYSNELFLAVSLLTVICIMSTCSYFAFYVVVLLFVIWAKMSSCISELPFKQTSLNTKLVHEKCLSATFLYKLSFHHRTHIHHLL